MTSPLIELISELNLSREINLGRVSVKEPYLALCTLCNLSKKGPAADHQRSFPFPTKFS